MALHERVAKGHRAVEVIPNGDPIGELMDEAITAISRRGVGQNDHLQVPVKPAFRC